MVWQDKREAVFLRVDETAPVDMVLMQGEDVINVAGCTELGLVLTPQDESYDLVYKSTDSPARVSIYDAPNGIVRFLPNPLDLVTGMVRLLGRWYVILGGKKFYFPQDGFFELNLLLDPTGFVTNQIQFRTDTVVVFY